MNVLLRVVLPAALMLSANSLAKTDVEPIKTKIVGGEVATQGDWPWMSALVYTYPGVSTTLTVDSTSFDTKAFTFSPEGNVSGEVIDCGLGGEVCSDATSKVCLIERGEFDFSEKANNCEAGGGVGVIIYNNVEGEISGTLGDGFVGTIPVISVTQADGETLKSKVGTVANIDVASGKLAQSSTCGSSFLGDKWVLTAAHCVDGTSASQIKVNVGEYDLSNGAENAIAVKRIYMHSDYDDVDIDNDVALLELVTSVQDVEAITLVNPEATQKLVLDNSLVTVMGWGGRVGYAPNKGPTSDFPDVLHQVELSLLSNQQCQQALSGHSITNAMICATFAGGGKGSCQGDSGGPLVVSTNEGWQQIGIVSWGVGCAADGFPDVYTRSSAFIDWIDEIRSGVAIEQLHDFGISPQAVEQSATLTVVNNSLLEANLTFSIDGDDEFTVDGAECAQLNAAAECQLTVNYSASEVGSHIAVIIITSDNTEIAVSASKVVAKAIAPAEELATQLATDTAVMQWYAGGDATWVAATAANEIESGVIDHNQESIVMVTFEGEGELTFEWAVSSEKPDDPDEPYDALYVYLDDVLFNFISGEVEFAASSINLKEGKHKITWIYKKDPGVSKFEDKGYLRNIAFTPTVVTTPTPPVVTEPTNPNARSSSGGTMAWLSLILVLLVNIRRKL
ncbi:MAG: trypsin-like serine protease [Colwellia sp.]|nr:trypsin-like serine protease [Colwellia sp.]